MTKSKEWHPDLGLSGTAIGLALELRLPSLPDEPLGANEGSCDPQAAVFDADDIGVKSVGSHENDREELTTDCCDSLIGKGFGLRELTIDSCDSLVGNATDLRDWPIMTAGSASSLSSESETDL
mmetsp:Transcript_6633/g.11292  ORF Transcript_6633/g.11292 Transcript_6633/m.11292 type:complete len:124 (-) Transcript_6633:394-765(-)